MLPPRLLALISVCSIVYVPFSHAQVFDPIHYGAIGDGRNDDTKAVLAALAAAKSNNGGEVLFDAQYSFLTGCFHVTSNIILNVKGKILALVPTLGSGGLVCKGVVQCHRASNVTITGGGTIDGRCSQENLQDYPCNAGDSRPHLLYFTSVTDVRFYDIKFKDSPAWTTGISGCTNVHISNVHVSAPSDSHNTDGFDIGCSSNVLLENSFYSGGDDAVAIACGENPFGALPPTENILVRNMTIGTSHGLSIGSDTGSGIRNVTFQDITCNGSNAGVKIKTERGRGGMIQDITYSNIRLYNVHTAIWFTFNYHPNLPPGNETATPQMKNIYVSNIYSNGAEFGWHLDGLPESVIVNAMFSNVTLVNTSKLFRQCEYIIGSCDNVKPSCPPCLL